MIPRPRPSLGARAALRALLAVASLCSLARCQRSAEGVCVEGLCLSLPLTTSGQRDNGRHTLRPDGAAGWINVQRFAPLERPESTEAHSLARLLGRRLQLASSYRVLSTGVATLLQQQVPTLNHAPIERRRNGTNVGVVEIKSNRRESREKSTTNE